MVLGCSGRLAPGLGQLSPACLLLRFRYYHSPSLVNYGAFPQTWEDPEYKDADVDLLGKPLLWRTVTNQSC